MIRVKGMLVGVAMTLMLVAVTPVQGSPITYYFGGQLDFVTGTCFSCLDLTPYFSVGDTFAGSFTFESTTADSNASVSLGTYGPGPAFSIAVSSFTFTNAAIGGSGSVQVRNDGPSDQFSANAETDASPLPGQFPQVFVLQLQDLTATAFGSTALPLTGIDLSDFGFNSFELSFMQSTVPFRNGSIRGGLDYLSLVDPDAPEPEPAPVPEPSSIVLMGAGLAVLARGRRRSR